MRAEHSFLLLCAHRWFYSGMGCSRPVSRIHALNSLVGKTLHMIAENPARKVQKLCKVPLECGTAYLAPFQTCRFCIHKERNPFFAGLNVLAQSKLR